MAQLLKDIQLGTKGDTDEEKEIRAVFEVIQHLLIEKYGWDKKLKGRFSINLILGLMDRVLHNKNIGRIIDEILYLEGCVDMDTFTKPESKFNSGLLSGLYHKHYNEAGMKSLYFNLIEPLKSNAGKRRFDEAYKSMLRAIEIRNFTNVEAVKYLTNQVFSNHLNSLKLQKKLTGEWIIYHKYNGENYYLAIAEHIHDNDKNIKYDDLAKQIQLYCAIEFPEFLGSLPIFS